MIELNPIIMEFAEKNYIAVGLFLTLLKGVSKITPWAWDDSIASLLVGMFQGLKRKNGGTNGPDIDNNRPAGGADKP